MISKNTWVICVICACMLFLACVGKPAENPITDLRIGEYIQFGSYDNTPILWRVIADSAIPEAKVGDKISGAPLLLSDRVLCSKAFDAAGNHGSSTQRNANGSNMWEYSSLRSWLISSNTAGEVEWLDGITPDAGNVESLVNGNEKGFLADGNFTEYERSLIKPVEQKELLYEDDYQLAEGGTTPYKYNDEITDIVNNYEEAYYKIVTDTVFILDPKQIHSVYILFGDYYRNQYSDYWLRGPDTNIYTDSSPANVLYIHRSDGVVMYKYAKYGSIGVRPALVLDGTLVKFKSGKGTAEDPYII